MAIIVPSGSTATTKWQARSQGAVNDYKASVANAGQRWQDSTSASGQIWATEVQKAVANGRFESGVAGKANEYQQMSTTKGATNYGGGITAGGAKYSTQIAKVLSVIQGITLPPPGPRNSPQNYSRSAAVGNALNAAKMSGAFN